VVEALDVRARVLPMTDEPVRTWVKTSGDWVAFQEFMIKLRGATPEAVEFHGIEAAAPTAEVLSVIESAEAIVIGPSNPVISIAPILAVPGMTDALVATAAPIVAVSPFVGGEVLKGPTVAFCAMAGLPAGVGALEQVYAGLIDGVVADERAAALPTLQTNVLMDSPEARRRVADEALEFARALASHG
jgi:LPPG:FO 2-phospho-L-lactate transferase